MLLNKIYMKQIITSFAIALLALQACKQNPTESSANSTENAMEIKVSGETETQQKLNPPMLPGAIGDRAAKKVIVHLEATEEEGELADGVTYKFWTFNSKVLSCQITFYIGQFDPINFCSRLLIFNFHQACRCFHSYPSWSFGLH